ISKSPFRSPTNASVFPSGDQPCQYEGDFCVMRRGAPPPIGTIYTRERCSSCELSLMTNCVPSGEIPWSLLQCVANPVSRICGVPPATEIFSILDTGFATHCNNDHGI